MIRILFYFAIAFIGYMTIFHPFVKGEDVAFERCTEVQSHDTCVYAFR